MPPILTDTRGIVSKKGRKAGKPSRPQKFSKKLSVVYKLSLVAPAVETSYFLAYYFRGVL